MKTDQPKPATGDRGKDGIYNAANGILQSQPKPATGEWTAEYVAKFLIVHSDWQQQIADAHNASLAACHAEIRELERSRERIGQKLAAAWRTGHADAQSPALERIDELHKQLAAEREKVKELEFRCSSLVQTQIDDLARHKQQLAAAKVK